jgi:hypothetical protein
VIYEYMHLETLETEKIQLICRLTNPVLFHLSMKTPPQLAGYALTRISWTGTTAWRKGAWQTRTRAEQKK